MYLSSNKKMKVMLRDKTIDLKETKDLYGRLLVLAKSSREIDQKQAIGNFEFTLTRPRALFTPDGAALLPCTDKSKLILLLEKIGATDVASEPELRRARASYCPADPASDSYGHGSYWW